MIVLRPDQYKLKSDIYSSWGAGNRNVMGCLATGGGKSVIMSSIARDLYEMRMRFPVIAHRKELVSQMSHHIARQDIPHRVIASADTVRAIIASHREEFGMSYVHPTERTSIAGIDTLTSPKRAAELKEWGGQQDYFFGDEGHHFLRANKWGRGVDMLPRARGLLMTATPGRPDGQGLGRETDGIVDDLVFGPEMRWLIDNGALTDYEIVCPESDIQVSDEDITDGGDYSPKKLKAAAEKSRIVGDVVREYTRYALFKRAICFATDVETANKIAQQFNDVGIRAASVSAETPDNVREKYIKDFKRGLIYILVNVDLFDEGFDVPACECVIMARPTASIVKYLQMFGRALRTMPGKLYGLIIDHVGNVWKRHGLPDKPRVWGLGRRDKRGKSEKDPEDMPMTRCRNVERVPPCCKPYPRVLSACPHCGWSPPLPEPGSRTIEQVDGDLILLDRAALELKRKAMQIESAASVGSRVAFAAGFSGAGKRAREAQEEKIEAHSRLSDAIAQWAAIERAKGRSDSETYRRFYLTVGMDVMEALNAERSREDFETLAHRVEGWYS